MYYNIVFDGGNCQDIFFRRYKSDMHALTKAWHDLERQPSQPNYGSRMATKAKVYAFTSGAEAEAEPLAIVRADGMIEFAEAE